jgi:hypothetical protein
MLKHLLLITGNYEDDDSCILLCLKCVELLVIDISSFEELLFCVLLCADRSFVLFVWIRIFVVTHTHTFSHSHILSFSVWKIPKKTISRSKKSTLFSLFLIPLNYLLFLPNWDLFVFLFLSSRHKIVIVEGLYLFLQIPVWESICELFDERWFIDCDLDIAMRRVEVRNSIEIGFPPDVVRNPLLFSSILNLFPKTNSWTIANESKSSLRSLEITITITTTTTTTESSACSRKRSFECSTRSWERKTESSSFYCLTVRSNIGKISQ